MLVELFAIILTILAILSMIFRLSDWWFYLLMVGIFCTFTSYILILIGYKITGKIKKDYFEK